MDKAKLFIQFLLILAALGSIPEAKENSNVTVQTHHTNRLIHESSPYLLQHAHNPVDWYTWGQEAFETAKKEDKPVFLSVGYSTCHWCHVMAHESFENAQIAELLNKHFVSVKVDREELPDVDAVYMDFVQKTTGSGGWPMSVFLTPQAKPFYGGTYFPPVDAYGRPGFETLLNAIQDAWQNRRETLLLSADRLTTALQENVQKADAVTIDKTVLEKTVQMLEQIYDTRYGGFGGDPKFPQPSMLSFLLVYAACFHNENAYKMLEHTLLKMSEGGIHDHLAGGFHRYSVDEKWLVPHFEKMLYDQALISRALIQTYQVSKRPEFRKITKQLFQYVLRDMTSPQGGFYSAEDADSDEKEGAFYVWTSAQIDAVMNRTEAELIKMFYGVTDEGNYEHGTNILNITTPLSDAAQTSGFNPKEAEAILETAKQKLYEERTKRNRPHRDEKIITGWNGLMISSLAYGGAVFNEPHYTQAAAKSADFVLDHLYKDGRLMRYYGRSKPNEYGVLEDYAYFIQGLIDLFQADFNPRWLQSAVELTDQMIELFSDEKGGGFFMTGKDAQQLIVQKRPDYDGAMPSGNSVAAGMLIRLSELTGNTHYLNEASNTLAGFQDRLNNNPLSLTEMLTAAALWQGPRGEIVIVGELKSEQTQRILSDIRSRFLPNTVVLVSDPSSNAALLDRITEVVKGREAIDQEVTVYLCRDFACKKPITDFEEFRKEMDKLR